MASAVSQRDAEIEAAKKEAEASKAARGVRERERDEAAGRVDEMRFRLSSAIQAGFQVVKHAP